jgi:iron complex transport system substrate-binding protein
MMFRKTLLFTIIPALFLAACSPASSAVQGGITLTDGLGRAVTLTVPAQRIVSLAPSNTEILFAVGAGLQIIGRDSISDYPAEAAQLTDVGGGFGELNREAILAQNPDLVLAAPITPEGQILDLEKAGLTVYMLPNPKSFEELYANLETVGQITGHEKEAAELVESLKVRVQAVEEKIAPLSDRPLVFYELDATDPNAPWTAGPGTFVDMIVNAAGGLNLGADLEGEWVQISVEELIAKNPSVIVLGDAVFGGVTPEIVKARTGWDGLTAVKENKIFPFDDNLVSRPGPRLVDGLEALAKLLHPDLFK